MSWAIGYDSNWKRDIGYGVPSICDHPGCKEEIDRGLSYVCGGLPEGGDVGCGLYFCSNHRRHFLHDQFVCKACKKGWLPYDPKPDCPEWTQHKLTDPSWERWRKENGL